MLPRVRVAPSPGREERQARALLVILSVALALVWSGTPGVVRTLATLALVASVGIVVARESRGAPVLLALLALWAVAQARIPTLAITYTDRLRLEGLAAFLPLAIFLSLLHVAHGQAKPARVLVVVAAILAGVGTFVRLGETYLLFGRPGDTATIVHALRFDPAASLWSAAAWALAFGLLARALPANRPRAQQGAAWSGAFMGFILVTSGTPAILETAASPIDDLEIGFHASQVSQVPDGARLVHLEASMPRTQPARGVFDFADLDIELAAASTRGLDVYLLVSTYPPKWLIDAYPESVMVDADGRAFVWIDEAPGTSMERIWDMSFADERVNDEKAAHVAQVVARYGDHPAVKWVAVVNEPTYPVDWNLLRWGSFDAATVAAFRESLREETGENLTKLELAYGISVTSWEDVLPPRLPLGRLGERWMGFREGLLVQHTTGLMDVAKALTDRPVTTKLMAHSLTRFAEPQAGLSDATYRALARASDVVSIDLYPATQRDLLRQLEYFRTISEGKSIIVAEFNLALGTHLPFAGVRMLAALETIARHADAVILFTASGHYLYGIDEDSAAMEATRIARMGFFDAGYAAAFESLARREARELGAFPSRAFDVTAWMRLVE